jgi:hypothetical protein
VADLLRLVKIDRHTRTTEAGRGMCSGGAHQPTADDGDAPTRNLIRGKGK